MCIVSKLDDQFVVIGMRPDPNPIHVAIDFGSECTIMRSDAHGPELAYLFKMEGRMSRVGLEDLIILVCELADVGRQCPVKRPEPG